MFVYELNVVLNSNVVSCSVSFMLTLTWDIDILCDKLTSEVNPLGWGFDTKPVGWGQVNRSEVEETMYISLL